MPRFLIVLTLAALSLASGCLRTGANGGSTSDAANDSMTLVATAPSDTRRDADEYWMIYVHGNETRGGPDVACAAAPPTYEIDTSQRSLSYDPETYPIDVQVVRVAVAFDHRQPSSCRAAYGLDLNPAGTAEKSMGGFGTLRIEILDDGKLIVQGDRELPLGKALDVSYDRRNPEDGLPSKGSFRVENLGAWPQSGLRPFGQAFEPIRVEHDFTSEPREAKFDLPPDPGRGRSSIRFVPLGAATACADAGVHVRITDPAGREIASEVPATSGIASGACSRPKEFSAQLTSGTWTVTFSGRGSMRAVVDVAPE